MVKKRKRLMIVPVVAVVGVLTTSVILYRQLNSPANSGSQHSTSEYIGLTTSQAQAKAHNEGLTYRDVSPGRQGVVLSGDYRSDRINVTIVDGKVTKAEYY